MWNEKGRLWRFLLHSWVNRDHLPRNDIKLIEIVIKLHPKGCFFMPCCRFLPLGSVDFWLTAATLSVTGSRTKCRTNIHTNSRINVHINSCTNIHTKRRTNVHTKSRTNSRTKLKKENVKRSLIKFKRKPMFAMNTQL